MAIRAIRVALVLSILPAAGCGTVANLARPGPEGGGKVPFGGVKQDVWRVKTAANGELGVGAHPESEPHPQVARTLLWAADVPFSLIGDVLTWPYVVAYSFINQPVPTPPVVVQGGPPGPLPPPVTPATADGQPQTLPPPPPPMK